MTERTDALFAVDYTPWLAQRLVARSSAERRVIVAARQVGKTMHAAFEVLRVAFERPGSTSAILAPTKQYLRRSIKKLQAFAQEVPGVHWKEGRFRFELENGSTIECVSGEQQDGEGIRGLTVDGILWIDEAALVDDKAFQVAKNTLLATQGTLLITTTPVGRNWVWREYTRESSAGSESEGEATLARFRFRAQDSPFIASARLERHRREALPEAAAQELDAMFVDEVFRPFPDLSRLFVKRFPDRGAKAALSNVLGVDLGERQDWTVVTLMNAFGEAVVLGRWQHVEWVHGMEEIARLALLHDAIVVVDDGVGAPVGGAVEYELRTRGVKKVERVHTAAPGVKQELVELARGDVYHGRVHVLRDESDDDAKELADQLRHELTNFQGVRRVQHGREVTSYHGLRVEGEHDDCVISLCLANWGRAKLTAALGQGDPDVPLEDVVRLNTALRRRLGGAGGLGGAGLPDPFGGFFGGGGRLW